ncbi:hypothetical protein FKM82_006188 [Ascaphus truei]
MAGEGELHLSFSLPISASSFIFPFCCFLYLTLTLRVTEGMADHNNVGDVGLVSFLPIHCCVMYFLFFYFIKHSGSIRLNKIEKKNDI